MPERALVRQNNNNPTLMKFNQRLLLSFVAPAALFVVAHIVEVLVVAYAMTWRHSVRFLRRSSIVRFASASVVACLISTLLALCVLTLFAEQHIAIREAAIWFAADLLGLLLHVPILWILLMPLAVPTYVLAFVSLGLFDFAGPVQSTLRSWFGSSSWFPDVRSTAGVVAEHAVEITGTFYPNMFAAHPELMR